MDKTKATSHLTFIQLLAWALPSLVLSLTMVPVNAVLPTLYAQHAQVSVAAVGSTVYPLAGHRGWGPLFAPASSVKHTFQHVGNDQAAGHNQYQVAASLLPFIAVVLRQLVDERIGHPRFCNCRL